jgi:hypothetical protein
VAGQSDRREEGNRGANRGEKLETEAELADDTDPLPLLAQEWPRPSTNEVAATRAPRYYQPQRDRTLSLTVEKIRLIVRLIDVPVIDFNTSDALDRGVIHLPQTPMPWNRVGE